MKLLFRALFESIFDLMVQSRKKLAVILIFLAMLCAVVLLIFWRPNENASHLSNVPSATEETPSSSSAQLDNENADTSADTGVDASANISVDTNKDNADSTTQNAQLSTVEDEQGSNLSEQASTQSEQANTQSDQANAQSYLANTQSSQASTQSTPEQQTESNAVANSGLADSGLAATPQTQIKANSAPNESSIERQDDELLLAVSTEPDQAIGPLEMERLVIPSIDLDIPVAELGWHTTEGRSGLIFSEWDVADSAAGWHKDSAKPGEGGNVVMSGHNNVLGAVFRELDQLNQGDQAFIYAGDKIHTYAIEQILVVPELRATDEQRAENAKWIDSFDDDRLTLVSCWPRDDNTHRIIVVGHAVDG